MFLTKKIIVTLLISCAGILNANAVEVVYKADGLENCAVVGNYKKKMKMKASKAKIERKLISAGKKDDATHVYVSKYIDSTEEGKGIKVIAIGKRCS